MRGGPAEKVGLASLDVILAFDGQPVDHSSQLQWLASMGGVGKTVTLRVSRDGKPFDIKVTLGELKDPPVTPAAGRRGHGPPPGPPPPDPGTQQGPSGRGFSGRD